MLIQDIKFGVLVLLLSLSELTLSNGGFQDISNSNRSLSKMIDLIRPVDEWSEIALSVRQNTENDHCGTLKNLVHKLNFHH
jgi:hypothetical protein